MTRIFLVWLLLIPILSFAQTPEEIYIDAVALKNNKKNKEALAKFQEAVKKDPELYKAHYEIGWCQNDLENYTEAIKSLRLARKKMNEIPKLHFELGYAFEKSKQYDSARNEFELCRKLKPDYSNIYKRIGNTYYYEDNYEKALSNYKEHLVQKPTEDEYLFWYRKGFTENALKKFSDAVQSLMKSLNTKKDYANTYLELGFANSRLKLDETAITNYNKAIELDPKSHVGYNGIGEIYRDNKKDYVKAMEWYQKALSVKPNERKANFGIGYCLNSQQKYTEAIPYLTKAIEFEKDYIAAYIELGYSYYKTGEQTQAEKNFLKGLSLNSKSENALYYLGLLYVSQKNKAKAQNMLVELKNLNSKNAAALQDKINAL